MKVFYYVYKTTNIINNKFYIGVHQTKNLDDGYLGSGKILQFAIKKYGKENFTKEIINFYDNERDMYQAEAELVTEEFLKNKNVYNITVGGLGANNKQNLLHGKELIDKMKEKGTYERWLKSTKLAQIKANKKASDVWTGKKHTEETKEKIGKANSKHQSGSGNSQYGKCWIHNTEYRESKSILKEELSYWLFKGWFIGRKLKFQEFGTPYTVEKEFKKIKKQNTNLRVKKQSKSIEKFNKKLEEANYYWTLFKTSNCKSIREFCRKGFYEKSHVALTNMWKKYINEYNELVKHGKPLKF